MFVDSEGTRPKITKPSPSLCYGRFVQSDPIGYGDGLNWYNYVGSDPVNYTDPSGLEETGDIVITATRDGGGGGYLPSWIFSAPTLSPSFGEGIGGGGGSDTGDIIITGTKNQTKPTKAPPAGTSNLALYLDDIIVTARRDNHTNKGHTITLTYARWRGFPYLVGPTAGHYTYFSRNGVCGAPISGAKVAQGAAGGAVSGVVGWTARLAIGALAGSEAGPAGSLAGAGLAAAGGAAGGAVKSTFDQSCFGN